MGFLCPAKGPEYGAYRASAKCHWKFSFHLLDTINTVKVFSFVPLGPKLHGKGPSWFPISFGEIWGWSAKRNLALVRKHLKSRGDPLCKNLMKARRLKCFSTLRYDGKYIYETIDLANWRHLSIFFSLCSTVSLVSVKPFNRCLIDAVRNSFPIMYHFNYPMVFSDLSWIPLSLRQIICCVSSSSAWILLIFSWLLP